MEVTNYSLYTLNQKTANSIPVCSSRQCSKVYYKERLVASFNPQAQQWYCCMTPDIIAQTHGTSLEVYTEPDPTVYIGQGLKPTAFWRRPRRPGR